ncbi:MAG: peptidyl-prolyl cis-trans isomerase [Thermoanaerobaculia bacterium]|nr:peptidyl-prolyl cis-trans isomerase [Thermoanaerobaculia bacterium]
MTRGSLGLPRWIVLLAGAGSLVACTERSPVPDPSPKTALVADWNGVEISVDAVDQRILEFPAAERPQPGEDLELWYREQIRQLIVDRQLVEEAENSDLEADPTFALVRHEAEIQITAEQCLASLAAGLEPITASEVRARYDERIGDFSLPERRFAYQIFLRKDSGDSPESALSEARRLRQRILEGEDFRRLASAHSDSESRHRQGSLSWIVRGQLPTGFEEVLFALDEGVPSEPVETRDGVHLFLVDRILPARDLSFDEARPNLEKQLQAEHRAAWTADLEATMVLPDNRLILDREAFGETLRSGDPSAIVLRLNDFELTLEDLRRRVQSAAGSGTTSSPGDHGQVPPGQAAWQELERLRFREQLNAHCDSLDLLDSDLIDRRLEGWTKDRLLTWHRQRRLAELAARDESAMELFYSSNPQLFSESPKWRLRHLTVPLGDDGRVAMSRLERAAQQPGVDLETLQAELGGDLRDLPLQDLNSLGRISSNLPPMIAPLKEGRLSSPYRTDDSLHIFECLERSEGRVHPYDEVRERVVAAYVAQHAQELYQRLSDEILTQGELTIYPEGLSELRKSGLAAREVTVDQLEALLDDLQ